MKKRITIAIVLCAAMVFAGCSKTQLTQADLTANNDSANASAACYEARKLDLTGVSKDAIPYLVMSKQYSDSILAITGNDPCKVTNAFDVQIAEVEAKNKAVSTGLGVAGDVGKIFIGADVLKTGFKAAGDTFTATDQASIKASEFSAADGSSVISDASIAEGSSVTPSNTDTNTATSTATYENTTTTTE